MLIEHTCNDDCLKNTRTAKYIIICVMCDSKFNGKCFHISTAPVINSINADSNSFFICTKCYNTLKKSKHNRRSTTRTSMSIPSSSAPSIDGNRSISSAKDISHNSNVVNITQSNFDSLFKLVHDLDAKISKVNETSDKIYSSIKTKFRDEPTMTHNNHDDDVLKIINRWKSNDNVDISQASTPIFNTNLNDNSRTIGENNIDAPSTQQLENEVLSAFSNLGSSQPNATIDLTTENSTVMGKSIKEAMSQANDNIIINVPESLKNERQKMHMHTSSDNGLGNGLGVEQTCELHLSKCNVNITTDHIYEFLQMRGIEQNKVRVFQLTKKNQDLSALSFISFKLVTCIGTAGVLRTPGFWPDKCLIKDYIRPPQKSSARDKNASIADFLYRRPPMSLHP